VRVLTGFPELPEPEPAPALVRVVTGRAGEPEPGTPPRLLVRVVTGVPAGVTVPVCEPLTRVATPPAAAAVPGTAWFPDAPVLGALLPPCATAAAP
jgi:hypothetical protein